MASRPLPSRGGGGAPGAGVGRDLSATAARPCPGLVVASHTHGGSRRKRSQCFAFTLIANLPEYIHAAGKFRCSLALPASGRCSASREPLPSALAPATNLELKTRAARPPSLALWFEPIPGLAWVLFLIWSAVGVVVMPLEVGETTLRRWIPNASLQDAAVQLLHVSDAIWIFLGAVNVYFHTVRAEGLPVARRWAAIILVGSGCLEWIGATTGYPFGPYRYTDNFGWRLGGVVPVTIPLAWLIVLLCGRYVVLGWFPSAARWQIALGVACVALFTDVNLEFVAWKVRAYWVWYPHLRTTPPDWPPVQNFVSWFGFSFALAWLLPPNYQLRTNAPGVRRPLLVLAVMNGLFLLVHLVRRWRAV